MRADPQVAQMEQWLKARRLRGFSQGGATTTPGRSQVPAGGDELPPPALVALLEQLLAEQR